jgi:hypothetical protein
LRPERPFLLSAGEAFRRGFRAAAQNLPSILALQAAMAALVAMYYLWAPGAALLSRYAAWQQSGGVFGNGLAAAIAGGVLSELSLVYFQDRGRWSWRHVENLGFKFAIFFVSGCIVFEFYRLQAHWWGEGASLAVLVPKVMVDQFGYTVVWATPYYAVLTRWHALRYSAPRLWQEVLNRDFLAERMLPVLAVNWMFWIPAITLVYAMPTALQAPLYVFATAIWGLLVATVGGQAPASPTARDSVAAASPPMLADPAD